MNKEQLRARFERNLNGHFDIEKDEDGEYTNFDTGNMFASFLVGAAYARSEALEEIAKLCEAKLLKLEESAQYARKNGDHDDASNIRSSAWHLNILADAIRAIINKEQAQ